MKSTKKGKAKLRNLVKLAADQGITPFDPNKNPDWEVPTEDEMNRYFEALKKKPDSLQGDVE